MKQEAKKRAAKRIEMTTAAAAPSIAYISLDDRTAVAIEIKISVKVLKQVVWAKGLCLPLQNGGGVHLPEISHVTRVAPFRS